MNKKLWLTMMAVITVATMILSACAPAATTVAPKPTTPPQPTAVAKPTDKPTEPPPTTVPDEWANVDPTGQKVMWWHNHPAERDEVINKILDGFNSTNGYGITVSAEYQGSYAEIYNKMLAVLNTSDAPQLVVAYQNNAATYQLGGGLVDMNPLVNSPKWGLSEEEQNDFFPGFWIQDVFPTFGNARLGFPPQRSMEALYYNEEWLKELKAAGKIDFDGPPATPEQFKAAACAAKDNAFSKATAEGPIGYEMKTDASHAASFAFGFGGDIYDYKNNKYIYSSEASVKAWTFIQDLFKNGCASIVAVPYGDQADFGNGKLLFSIGSTSGLPYYKSAVDSGAKFAWSIGALPHSTPEPAQNIYGASISIPKTTPEAELAAWLFLKYFTSPDIQAEWAKASNYFPVRASVAEKMVDYFAANPVYKAGFDLLQYGKFEPPVPGYDPVRVKVSEAEAAIADGADVATTLAGLDVTANGILAEFMAEPLPPPKKACQVTDVGGIDDKSFNATAWKGVEDAIKLLRVEGTYLESQQQTDYEKNINAFLEEKCDIIISVGFLLGDATKIAAEANPTVKFAIVDFGYDPVIPNVRGSGYQIDQATFLAGYLAAATTKTGIVGTYGGMQIPPVTAFMDGFYMGVQKYNEVKGTKVKVIGWDPATQTGSFTGNFESTDDGKTLTLSMLDEGADIIMPVAGPVGQGTLAALKERGSGLMIGVDNDWSVYYSEYKEFILASALKNMDAWVFDSIKRVVNGNFKGEQYLGTLKNKGVGLAYGVGWVDQISAELKAEIEQLIKDIIAGTIATMPTPAP
jgi:basic membrane lipoprotein Med (substrate-binding protein (PBP1-ABC) superfamily)/ABC-type glycerol-3-phosphate transport system substrate-binding protein